MGLITPDLSGIVDGQVGDAADWTTPFNTIINEFNGNIDNDNIKAAAGIAFSKLATDAWTAYSPNLYKADSTTALTGTFRFARYQQIGKTVYGIINFDTVNDPAGSSIFVDLPVTALGNAGYYTMYGPAWTNSNGTVGTGQFISKLGATATKGAVVLPANNTWATSAGGNAFYVCFQYEAA